ncbi:hypothetical protein DFH08DRAFT_719340 [Mycena albidolilacea]|uniref:Uncharacterized protein n=1 Tax=Mycena albidolilacea TaxID=1033008 RepID=A0AAD6Z5Z5_9AGAR|nr:hypothetical protein DFH08DRAFT_719340 [Mycena albidolilacea]
MNSSVFKLRKFELDEPEWKILGNLLTVLRMYKAATLAFSNSISTIANAIPTMDKIDELFTLQGDKALDPAVRAAPEFAKNCLNKYWFNHCIQAPDRQKLPRMQTRSRRVA